MDARCWNVKDHHEFCAEVQGGQIVGGNHAGPLYHITDLSYEDKLCLLITVDEHLT